MTENNDTDPRQRLRPNRSDPLHDQQLHRDVQATNEQTMRAQGPLPPGGLSVQPKRRPDLPRPKANPEPESNDDLQTTSEQPMNTTNEQKGAFDWHEFPEGRARFIGGVRGAEQLGNEGFCIRIDGLPEMFGEIKEKFSENRHDYNLEVLACGWPGKEWLGMPMPGMSYRFSPEELAVVRSLILQLVEAVRHYEDRPAFLTEFPTSHFLGTVFFADGWAAMNDGALAHG